VSLGHVFGTFHLLSFDFFPTGLTDTFQDGIFVVVVVVSEPIVVVVVVVTLVIFGMEDIFLLTRKRNHVLLFLLLGFAITTLLIAFECLLIACDDDDDDRVLRSERDRDRRPPLAFEPSWRALLISSNDCSIRFCTFSYFD
jgi:hypothetical protein